MYYMLHMYMCTYIYMCVHVPFGYSEAEKESKFMKSLKTWDYSEPDTHPINFEIME